jgi:hypothetical protein
MEMTDGSCIIAGTTKSIVDTKDIYNNDVYLLRLDSEGSVLWEKSFGGTDSDWASSVSLAEDGDVVIAGHTNSSGNGFFDLLFAKIRNQ